MLSNLASWFMPSLSIMKKNVPLSVLKAIEPILPKLNSNGMVVEKSDNIIMKVVDSEEGSELFFEITSAEINNTGANNLRLRYKPKSEHDTSVLSTVVEAKNFDATFKYWFAIIEEYNRVKSIYDDPILKKYADDFYTEFESADDDANTASFNLKQQLLLDSALTQVIQVLNEQTTEVNKEVIAEIIEEVEEVQSTVTGITKQETFTKLSKIFAKIQKVGIKVVKHVAPIIEKEIIGTIIKSTVTAAGVAAAATHLLN